jgi:hypothetical protein
MAEPSRLSRAAGAALLILGAVGSAGAETLAAQGASARARSLAFYSEQGAPRPALPSVPAAIEPSAATDPALETPGESPAAAAVLGQPARAEAAPGTPAWREAQAKRVILLVAVATVAGALTVLLRER